MRFPISITSVLEKGILKVIIVCQLILAFSSNSYADSPLQITLAYQTNETYPYQMGYGTQVANPPGVALDIIKAAAKEMGIEVKFVRYPNKRVLLSLKNGVVDGAFVFSFKQDRLVNGRYPFKDGKLDTARRITTLSYFLYTLEGSSVTWDGETISGLKTARVGAGRGYSIVSDLKKMDVPVSEFESEIKTFKLLSLNRLEAVAAQDTTADPLIEAKGYKRIVKNLPPLKTKPYFLMLSSQFVDKHPDVAEQLWNSIAQVRDQVIQGVSRTYLK